MNRRPLILLMVCGWSLGSLLVTAGATWAGYSDDPTRAAVVHELNACLSRLIGVPVDQIWKSELNTNERHIECANQLLSTIQDPSDGRRALTICARGDIYWWAKDYERARADYSTCLSYMAKITAKIDMLEEDETNLYQRRALANLVLRNLDEASSDLDKAEQLRKTYAPERYRPADFSLTRADIELQMGKYAAAVKDYESVKRYWADQAIAQGKPYVASMYFTPEAEEHLKLARRSLVGQDQSPPSLPIPDGGACRLYPNLC